MDCCECGTEPPNSGNVACFLPGRAKDLSALLYVMSIVESVNHTKIMIRVPLLIVTYLLSKFGGGSKGNSRKIQCEKFPFLNSVKCRAHRM